MKKYSVYGMSCAACSSKVEKTVSALDGVTKCNVNLLTEKMTVEGSADASDIISAIRKIGYNAEIDNGEKAERKAEKKTENGTGEIGKRLVLSLVFLLPLMYITMGYMMWSFPIPQFFKGNPTGTVLAELLFTVPVLIINRKFFINGTKGFLNGAPNMDTLVSLGAASSFVYSTAVLLVMTAKPERAEELMRGVYFESAAMILTLITVGKLLEAISKGKSTSALNSLMNLSPEYATVIVDGKEKIIPAENIRTGDIFTVKAGEGIPCDGIVMEGEGAVDESSLTGESVPANKEKGFPVYCATVNQYGYLKCRATDVGSDTVISKIVKSVSDATATKAPIARIADRVSAVFVPTVMGIALITFVMWLIMGKDIGYSLARSISVLVISCPCALGLATPVAVMVGSTVGAKNGILFKSAEILEECGKIRTVALDKTGTVTEGNLSVCDIIPAGDTTEKELLETAYALESKSSHPIAGAIVRKCGEKNVALKDTHNVTTVSGKGITALSEEGEITAGNLRFTEESARISPNEKELIKALSETLSKEGKTSVTVTKNKKILGVIALSDTVKEDSKNAIAHFKKMNIETVMLTGDSRYCAESVAESVGIDKVVSEILPIDKENQIRKLKAGGRCAMVGDGINDAPALTCADIGIAIGAGSDIAIDSADVVLINSSLTDAVNAVKLSRKTLKNIKENLFWAFFYNLIGIPVAAGVLISFGITLSPMFAAAAMSLSSFFVVMNALRLNLFKPIKKENVSDTATDGGSETVTNINAKTIENTNKNTNTNEVSKMTKVIKIEGMMCTHCSGRVKEVLEAIPQVENAEVSHEKGEAVVTLRDPLPDVSLKAAIEGAGYKYLG